MPGPIPTLLRDFCRQTVPLLCERANGRGMLKWAEEVVSTDRWNSFDRFAETTQTLVRGYEASGAQVEVDSFATGGRIGSGRWIIQEAADVLGATVDVVAPMRRRLIDYKKNPWQVIQWTTATPAQGVRTSLVVLDSAEAIAKQPPDGLVGKMVLTKLEPRSLLRDLADKGAVGVITDRPVHNLPNAVAWTKFGWGAVPLKDATARLVGLVLSENQGKALRRLVHKHPDLVLETKVDTRKYVGTHDVVSGLVRGAGNPEDEVWVLAHSAEPGAVDNASGVVVSLEIARVLEGLIQEGLLPRPKRTIRLLSGYECYGFFAYLERVRRLQTPLAGVVIDTVGSRPRVCDGRLEWHATIPMSAGFVDWVGEAIIRSVLRRANPGYRLSYEPFMATSDTLIGDPQYGFPCPWITTHHRKSGRGFDAYHSSGDTLALLSPKGLETCAASMAAYLYYLADAGSEDAAQLAESQTRRTLALLAGVKRPERAQYLAEGHRCNLDQLQRWLWGGERPALMRRFGDCADQIKKACRAVGRVSLGRVPAAARQVPRRTAPLSPTSENTPIDIGRRIGQSGLTPWALFWADGKRSLAQIAQAINGETAAQLGQKKRRVNSVDLAKLIDYFEAHAQLGYAELVAPQEMVTKKQLVTDLRRLGLEAGMDVMVHSSLSRIGFVEGGPQTVVDALLAAIGKRGTLLMPSFNHRAAMVYNPMTTPTTNGAIPDIMWRRPEAIRSVHPTHAVAAIGPRASEYCRDHLEVGIWAQDSPIGRLVHGGGYILALGTTHGTSTAYHVAELSVPCTCIDSFANTDRVVQADGQVVSVPGLAFRSGPCPVSTAKLDQSLDRRKLQRRGLVGGAESALVRALDLWQVRRQQLRGVCPECTVKPAIRP